MASDRQQFDLDRLRFADDVDWLPVAERARIKTPTVSLRIMATTAWIVATAVSLVAVGFIPPSRRQRGKQSGLRRRMLRSAVRRWLGPGAVRVRTVAELSDLADGTPVRMEGTVRCRPCQSGSPSPFEQLAMTLEVGSEEHPKVYHLIRDRAQDFELVDSRGCAVRIQAAGARLIGPPIVKRTRPIETLRSLEPIDWPPPLDEVRPILRRLAMGTYRLAEGDPIEIYGIKDRAIDRTIAERLARQDPICASLRSSRIAPLIVLTR